MLNTKRNIVRNLQIRIKTLPPPLSFWSNHCATVLVCWSVGRWGVWLVSWLVGRSVGWLLPLSLHVDLAFCADDAALLRHVPQTGAARRVPRHSSQYNLALAAQLKD
jgi:hypothetical protein